MPTQLTPLALLIACQTLLGERLRGRDGSRGDVPGWVLITVMTAFIVTGIWQYAGPKLQTILENAIDGVSGGSGPAE